MRRAFLLHYKNLGTILAPSFVSILGGNAMDKISMPVHNLIESGHMFVPVNSLLVQTASMAWKQIIARLEDFPEGFLVTRRGEPEADLGIIFRSGDGGGDYKYFFHLAHDLCAFMSPRQKALFAEFKPQLAVLDNLLKHLNDVAFQVARQLDLKCGHLFNKALLPIVKFSAKNSTPYATTTLRSLWYPPAQSQAGACPHIDRNLFSIHVGDEGGMLQAYANEQSEVASPICIPEAHAAVFFGVKAVYLSNGVVQPLWHGSTVEEGKDRLAMVHFVQADIGFEVPKAVEAYRAFYETCER